GPRHRVPLPPPQASQGNAQTLLPPMMPAAAEAETDADRDRRRVDGVAWAVVARGVPVNWRRGRGGSDDAAAKADQHERNRCHAVKPCHGSSSLFFNS